MMLRTCPTVARPRSRGAIVCRAAMEQNRAAFQPRLAAAFAAASLLLNAAPVWANTAAEPALTYEQELQALIQKRTGSEFSPDLTEFPNEQAIDAKAERELINEAVAAEKAESQPALSEAAALDSGAIKRAALEEVSAIQAATTGTDAKGGAKFTAAAPSGAGGQTGIIVAGGFATLLVAALAMNANSNAAPAADTTPAPAPAAPTDASGSAPISSDSSV